MGAAVSTNSAIDARHEQVRTNPAVWEVGPFDAALPGVYRLRLVLDGEVIRSAEIEGGYTARGIEKIVDRQSWRGALPLLDRVDPCSAVFMEWAYCLAVESGAELVVPERAIGIRIIVAEISRISAHLIHLARVARAAGSEIALHFLLRERERVLDLLELLTGSRHAPTFLLPGGVREDVTDGFLERVQETAQQLIQRIKEYNDLLTYNQAFVRRTGRSGRITREMAGGHGITGIPARIHTLQPDLRRTDERLGYARYRLQELDRFGAVHEPGDLHHRFVVRLHEIVQSARLLQELALGLPKGEFRAERPLIAADFEGRAMGETEGPRGRIRVSLSSNPDGTGPADTRIESPSVPLFASIPAYLSGAPLEDLSLLLEGLDLCITEVDL